MLYLIDQILFFLKVHQILGKNVHLLYFLDKVGFDRVELSRRSCSVESSRAYTNQDKACISML